MFVPSISPQLSGKGGVREIHRLCGRFGCPRASVWGGGRTQTCCRVCLHRSFAGRPDAFPTRFGYLRGDLFQKAVPWRQAHWPDFCRLTSFCAAGRRAPDARSDHREGHVASRFWPQMHQWIPRIEGGVRGFPGSKRPNFSDSFGLVCHWISRNDVASEVPACLLAFLFVAIAFPGWECGTARVVNRSGVS